MMDPASVLWGCPGLIQMPRWAKQCLCAFALTNLLLTGAAADEANDSYPEVKAAREVLRAVEAKDQKSLVEIASRDNPDPWLIADWLIMEEELAAAGALARAVKRPATAKLAVYVDSKRSRKKEEKARAALRSARAVAEAGKLKDAYPILEPLVCGDANVVSVQVLYVRGVAAYMNGRYDDAMASLKAASEHALRVGWVTARGQALQWIVQTATVQDDKQTAVAFAQERVLLETELDRPDRLADAGMALGKALQATQRPLAALAAFERAVAAARRAGDDKTAAKTSMLMAAVSEELGDIRVAIEHARAGLEAFQSLGEAKGVADALIALGSYFEATSEYERSRAFLERAVRYCLQHGLAYFHARALSHLGVTYQMLGAYPKALDAFHTSLKYDESKNDTPRIAGNLNNLAVLYNAIGDDDRAIRTLRRTLKLFEEVEGKKGIASACSNLGLLLLLRGERQEGTALLERSLRVRQDLGDQRGISVALSALGSAAVWETNYAEAIRLYREAAKIRKEAADRAGFVETMTNLAYVHLMNGEHDEALRLVVHAAQEVEALRSPQLELYTLSTLTLTHLEMNNPKLALEVAERALREMEHLLGGLSEVAAARVRTQRASIYELGALAAARIGVAGKVMKFLEAGRAGSLLESLGGRDALRFVELPGALRQAEADARIAEAKAAARYRRALRAGELAELRVAKKALVDATDRLRDVVAKIQRTAKAQAGLVYPRPLGLTEIQRHLRPNQVLVLYGFCAETTIAVVFDLDWVRAINLGPAARVDDAFKALGRVEARKDVGPALGRLRELLVTPLKLPGATTEVLVSPAGPLCYVPFGALFDQTVALTPSASTHALLSTERRRGAKGVLALGDPSYGAQAGGSGGVYTRGDRLFALPATRVEVQKVGDLVLLGKDASEQGLRSAITKQRSWRAVHLACHGRIDRDKPTLCALALTPDEEHDGFLTVLDVMRMRVPADLAVLSACETGTGKVVTGEGIIGLTRAFMYAGAPRVITSLWKVDDEATRALMIKFYELWNPKDGVGVGAAAALRKAQAFIRAQEKWSHPYYWAAWVLWGLPD